MNDTTLIIGYGPVGRATASILRARGQTFTVAQRTRPADLPRDIEFRTCDVLDAASVRAAVAGAQQVVLAVGLRYDGKVWQRDWPRLMSNVVEACADAGARLIFFDNLYMYGAQDRPLTEDMPLSAEGRKPAARAAATRVWMQAAEAGRLRVTALRAPDFYGPGVTLSHIGATGFKAIAEHKRASLMIPPDMPHDFAYVPDIGRAVVTLLEAPDDAFGGAWHMPSAPVSTTRQILMLGAAATGEPLRLAVLPPMLVRLLGGVVPIMREMSEMYFQWDRPYRVDASRFAKRFWSDVTPFEIGAAATIRSFQPR